jgi:hypothetical protein
LLLPFEIASFLSYLRTYACQGLAPVSAWDM